MVTVAKELLAAGHRRPTAADLHHMCSLTPVVSSANATAYATEVLEAKGRWLLSQAATKVRAISTDPAIPLPEAREPARQAVDEACRGRDPLRLRMVADVIDPVLEIAEKGTAAVLSTPWPDLDRWIGGLAPGRMIVIGARPGLGKSIMGTNLALHMAGIHHHAVLIASMEMPEIDVGQRLLSAHVPANLTGLQTGATTEAEWGKISTEYASLAEMPIAIDDQPDQTVTHIRATARNLRRMRDDLALIVVDYLQLIRPSAQRKNGTRAEEVAGISRDLKLLAREMNACVVAMAQLNRESAKRGTPSLADIRESGAVEADADQVVLIHQPDGDIPEVELLVEKNRHGERGTATVQVFGHNAQIRSAWRN
jgi:replicative DNA helicase